MRTPFVKMHGCGNDFVVLDARAADLPMTEARAAALADRRTGVGCDQFIVIEPAGARRRLHAHPQPRRRARPAPAATPPAASPACCTRRPAGATW